MLQSVSLDDKYALETGRIYITGIQALVRLPMMQRQRDQAAGLNTGCFISGYRGSPLGAFDQALWQARTFLEKNHIVFQPGVNEDLGATSIWGSQMLDLFPDPKYDGVFGIWYGKGPGVDRTGDVFKHANNAGTSKHGGVLALAGDDHTAKSSTLAHQSEYAFMDAMMPVLSPAGVQDVLDFGLYGWAMSRYSGLWVGFKCIAETMDSSASVHIDPHRVQIVEPTDFQLPEDGVHMRWPDPPLAQEERLHRHKVYAALAFARANKLDRVVVNPDGHARLGIVTHGKSYLDVMQALDDLGIDERHAREIGLSVYKVAMTWPLEREGVRHFAERVDELLVVEEKRALVENQLKEQLYNWHADIRPTVVGKFDEKGDWVLPSTGELTPARIARVIAQRLEKFYTSPRVKERLEFLSQKEAALQQAPAEISRTPYFCSGCPHNTSTKVPEGSFATAGIGCHYMAVWMDRNTITSSQMGGEGVAWVGLSPFTETPHIFANLGDGTYFHSGLMAIRAAVAGNVNITYKILFNDAVAMTGGQHVDGPLDVPQITRQVAAEGVKRIVVVSDEPEKYPRGTNFAPGVTVHHRRELDHIQRELREDEGVTVLVYDQTCAAEKRRRRKRGLFPDPPKRVFINEAVCEGCGDCSVASNCLSVVPVETEFGRKRAIDQSSCNKDYSCLNGFCPSFVTVHDGKVRKGSENSAPEAAAEFEMELPEPPLPSLDKPYGILVTGVGGTGVVTIGALLAMAAHLESKGATTLDQTGLAQKGGAVLSHVRIGAKPEDLHAVQIAAGGANLILGCDMVVAAGKDAIAKTRRDFTHAVVNSQEIPVADFTRNPDLKFPTDALHQTIASAAGQEHTDFVAATKLATALMGDSIASNLFMLGYAFQKGLIPVSGEAIEQAIRLNGVAIDMNLEAFTWGRRAAHDLGRVVELATPEGAEHKITDEPDIATTLEEIVRRRMRHLEGYQSRALAQRYAALVDRVKTVERERAPGKGGLAEAVAKYYAKLLAYKDEYEVARLYTDGDFGKALKRQFEGNYKLTLHLAPPIMAKRDPDSGHLQKREFGPWMFRAFGLLAKLKFLRGTAFDPFGHSAERKRERALIGEYETLIEELLAGLTPDNHRLAVALASVPEHIRGFGHVKEAHLEKAKAREAELLAQFRNPTPAPERVAAE
jgi:indolepyruvate ferredoxin oxidoreductase